MPCANEIVGGVQCRRALASLILPFPFVFGAAYTFALYPCQHGTYYYHFHEFLGLVLIQLNVQKNQQIIEYIPINYIDPEFMLFMLNYVH